MGRSSRLLSADRGRVRASRQLNPPSPASHPVEWHLPPRCPRGRSRVERRPTSGSLKMTAVGGGLTFVLGGGLDFHDRLVYICRYGSANLNADATRPAPRVRS
jgi:hypothetical protein